MGINEIVLWNHVALKDDFYIGVKTDMKSNVEPCGTTRAR